MWALTCEWAKLPWLVYLQNRHITAPSSSSSFPSPPHPDESSPSQSFAPGAADSSSASLPSSSAWVMRCRMRGSRSIESWRSGMSSANTGCNALLYNYLYQPSLLWINGIISQAIKHCQNKNKCWDIRVSESDIYFDMWWWCPYLIGWQCLGVILIHFIVFQVQE